MKLLCLILLSFLSISNSWSAGYNLARRWGMAIAAGYNVPILGNRFDERADGGATYGLYGTYHLNDESGLLLGYTRSDWVNSPTALRIYDIMYTHRPMSEKRFTPLWGLGLGFVDIANYSVDENLKLALRARAGLEYGLSPDLLVALAIDYQFINKMIFEDRNLTIGEVHALAGQVIFSFFFGK